MATHHAADANQPDPLLPKGSPLRVPHPDDTLSGGGEMGARIRAFDWSTTPLGPADTWPQSLRTAVSICLASRFPMLIWWGPDLIMLYNDAYRPMLGQSKHPSALGQAGRACWPEIWDTIGPMLTGVLQQGEATWSDDQLLLLDRNGYVEECYFTFSYSPIRDESGGVGGVFTAVTETTGAVLGARRLRTLREVAAATAEARAAEDACRLAAEALATCPDDLPFALAYLLKPDGTRATLCGAIGVRAGSPAAPAVITLDGSAKPDRDPWSLAQVMRTGQPALAQQLAARFGGEQCFTAALTPDTALVLPVARSGQERVEAFLVAGVSPRRALDGAYRAFFDLVAGQLATAIANARAHQEERERAEALAALDRAKTDFFSNVSHEFRTPLTLLLGPLADALGDVETPLAPHMRQHVKMAHRNALRLLKLVNTLLDFSRIEAGRADAVYEAVDLASVTRDLASAFRSAIERAGLRYVVDCLPLPDEMGPVYVDLDKWEKIVLNLLSNAFKFTFAGEIEISLHPARTSPTASPLRREGGQKRGKRSRRAATPAVELRVRDTGAGIAPDELPHLFERFHRVRGARARTHEGSGIGLALVRELVRLHGGTITVESAPEQGTCFTVTLPTGHAHLPVDRLGAGPQLAPTTLGAAPFVEEALRWLPNAQEPSSSQARDGAEADTLAARIATLAASAPRPGSSGVATREARARILIVDDNADMRDYLARLLGEHWEVEAVADGASALVSARSHPPDLVLCDIMLPGVDGLAVLRALRADPQTRALPIILLSARAGAEAAAEGLRAGADEYLVKPFAAGDLLVRVGSHLALAQMRQEAARREHEHAEHLRKLAAASLDISATLALDERTQRIAWHARNVLGARQAAIWVAVNGEEDPLVAASGLDDAAPVVARALAALPRLAAGHERLRRPLRLTGQQVVDDTELRELVALVGDAVQGWLSAPLTAREGQSIGLVAVAGKAETARGRDFSAEDEHMLVQLAQLAASTLENAALFEEIHTANAMRDAALLMVTHDLKQPLTAVKANVQMLKRQAGRAEHLESAYVRERLATIDETADKMTDQINELLDLARLQAGQPLKLECEPVELVAFIEQLVNEQRQTAARHTIRVEAETTALDGVWDVPRLARVLGNLLSNAVKYSPQGGEIVLRVRQEEPRVDEPGGPWALVSMTDQGMGIPPADLPHIFEPFRRASNAAKSTIPGSGIGLASARNVVTHHGGTLTAQSRLGAGTTFTLRLPLHPPADASADTSADA